MKEVFLSGSQKKINESKNNYEADAVIVHLPAATPQWQLLTKKGAHYFFYDTPPSPTDQVPTSLEDESSPTLQSRHDTPSNPQTHLYISETPKRSRKEKSKQTEITDSTPTESSTYLIPEPSPYLLGSNH